MFSNFQLRRALTAVVRDGSFSLPLIILLSLSSGLFCSSLELYRASATIGGRWMEPDRIGLIVFEASLPSSQERNKVAQTSRTLHFLEESANFLQIGAFSPQPRGVNTVSAGSPTFLLQSQVSQGFFNVLGTQPLLGRTFTENEDRIGGPAVTILSYQTWQNGFAGDPSVTGRTIQLQGVPHTVVGVMPQDLQEPFESTSKTDIWVPLRATAEPETGGAKYGIIARLDSDVSWPEATERMQILDQTTELQNTLPRGVNGNLRLVSLQEKLIQGVKRPLSLIVLCTLLGLLLAGSNASGLWLSHIEKHSGNLRIRLALGARQKDLWSGFFYEFSVLCALAFGCTLAVQGVCTAIVYRLPEGSIRLPPVVELSPRDILVSLATTGTVMVLAAVGPMSRVARLAQSPAAVIRQHSGLSNNRASGKIEKLLISMQISISVITLTAFLGFLVLFSKLDAPELTVSPEEILVATISLEEQRYTHRSSVEALFTRSKMELETIPGVDKVAIGLHCPYERWLNLDIEVEGVETSANSVTLADVSYTTKDYFGVLGFPLLSGRLFSDEDHMNSTPVVIVSSKFVHQYSNSRELLGRTISVSGKERKVVGIVGDVQLVPSWGSDSPLDVVPTVFVPASQVPSRFFQLVHSWYRPKWLIKTSSSAAMADLKKQVRWAITEVDPYLPIAKLATLQDQRISSLAEQIFVASLVSIVALVSILIAMIGLYSLVTRFIAARRRELGIRMALGASRLRLTLSTLATLGQVFLYGLLAGCPIAYALARSFGESFWKSGINIGLLSFGSSVIIVVLGLASCTAGLLGLTKVRPSELLSDANR